jgi:hypothetical protein
MKKFKAWRYKCEYCGKIGGSKYHMAKHERGCTKNPNRVCGLCRVNPDGWQEDLIIMQQVFACQGLEGLRKLTGNCPACILATIRTFEPPKTYHANGLRRWDNDNLWKVFNDLTDGFDFRKELERFWQEVNENQDCCY